MAQEKAQVEAPRAPASGKGDELERQRTLPDSVGCASSPSALRTDPAAIPGNSHLLRLEDDRSEQVSTGNGETDSPGGGERKERLYKKFGGQHSPTPTQDQGLLQSESGDMVQAGGGMEGKVEIPEPQGAVSRQEGKEH